MSARLAGRLYEQRIASFEMRMARDANAVKDSLRMGLLRKIKEETPDCFGCSRIQMSEDRDVMRDAIAIRVSCKDLQRPPVTGDRIACPDAFIGKFDGTEWQSMAPKWPEPKLRGREANFIVMDELSPFEPGRFVKAKELVSRDVPQTAYEETW